MDDKSGFRELETVMVEVKLSTERMTTKLEQLGDGIEKLEASISRIDSALSSQERRLIIVEQSIPRDLLQDLALMKNSISMHTRLIWLVGGAAISGWAKTLFNLLSQ